MNIGFVTAAYGSAPGGVTTSVENFALNLRRLGHKVFVYCPRYPDQNDSRWVTQISSFWTPLIPDYRVAVPWRAGKIFRQRFDQGLDVIHVHLPTLMGPAARSVAVENEIPFFVTYHTNLERYLGHYLPFVTDAMAFHVAKWFARRETRGTKKIFVPSTDIQEVLAAYDLSAPIEVLPTGIDLDLFGSPRPSVRSQYGISPDENMLLYVGRIGSEKNIDFLLRAFALIEQQSDNSHLVMVGSGRGLNNAKERVRRLGLEDRVHFSGYIEDKELLAAHYQSAEVFLFASLTETQGLVVLESFAAGTPVVAVNAPGVRDILKEDEKGGYLVPEDENTFMRKALSLLHNPSNLRQKASEAVKVAEQFSASRMASRLLAVYRKSI